MNRSTQNLISLIRGTTVFCHTYDGRRKMHPFEFLCSIGDIYRADNGFEPERVDFSRGVLQDAIGQNS